MLQNENKKDNLLILTNIINISEQHSRDFNRWSDILGDLGNANAGGTIYFQVL